MRSYTARRHTGTRSSARQRGAALVVGMVMLAIITLLAITAMNTSSTELVMAGNEQFRERAFQMAEAGVELGMRDLETGKVKPQPGAPAVEKGPVKSVSQSEDQYSIASAYMGEDSDIPGYSAGKFVGLHYRVTSTGQSVRNARSVQVQGSYLINQGSSGGSGDPISYLPNTAAP